MRKYSMPGSYGSVHLRPRSHYSGAQLVAIQCMVAHHPNMTGRLAFARQAYKYAQLRAPGLAGQVYPARLVSWCVRYTSLHYVYGVAWRGTKYHRLQQLMCLR